MSVFATATGIGSWPAMPPRQAAAVIVGELPGLPHLVELPSRGVGADLIGRAGALLVDIAIDTTPRGYRVAARPGAVTRRATSLLAEDLDALDEAWETAGLAGEGRPVKVQVPGPITLAAELELGNGHRAVTDPGALRDLAASLAEGIRTHTADLVRRLNTPVVVQLDEPALPAALAGHLTGVTALTPVPAVEQAVAVELLDACAAHADTVLHCCARQLPWKLLRRTVIAAVAVDVSQLARGDEDGVGEFIDAGRSVLLGAVPALEPARRPSVEQVAGAAAALIDRIGLPRPVLAERVGITPACGLAGASMGWARRAIELARLAAAALADDPETVFGDSLQS